MADRKTLAIAGLLLCLIGITISSVRLAWVTYDFIRGNAVTPVEPVPEDEFYDPFDSMEPMD